MSLKVKQDLFSMQHLSSKGKMKKNEEENKFNQNVNLQLKSNLKLTLPWMGC